MIKKADACMHPLFYLPVQRFLFLQSQFYKTTVYETFFTGNSCYTVIKLL